MPPKPQVFKTPDGKEFTSKAEWRDYMMATFYSFKNKVNEPAPLVKTPGVVDGQMFDIADCENSTLVVMDHTEQVQIDMVKNCRIFLGAGASSIFIRNCDNCVFYTCCRQLRLREVTNSKFYIYSMAEVHIEYSNGLQFAPFNGGYPEHAAHLRAANLDVKHNLWYDIYDHNDPGKTHANWSLLPESEYEEPWFPAGSPCEPAVPRTKPGSVKVETPAENMQSFSLQQMMLDAQKGKASAGAAPVAPPAPAVPPANAPAVPPAAPAAAPAAAPVAAPAAVPAVPVVSSPWVNGPPAEIIKVLRAFLSFSGLNDIYDLAHNGAMVILPDGNELSVNDYSLVLPSNKSTLWNVVKISLSEGDTGAVVDFWVHHAVASPTVSRNSAFLTTKAGVWKLEHLHLGPNVDPSRAPASPRNL